MSVPGETFAFPYELVPNEAWWSRAVAPFAPSDVDPQSEAAFRFDRRALVGSAGSCFASNIARYLRARGFTYHETETAPPFLDDAERRARHFGEFSARYGFVYTTLQLDQLLARALGEFVPLEPAWRKGAKWLDPFRPRIEPNGFSSLEELEADRRAHLSAVRRLFESLDVFVFTLGLTETWVTAADGAALPMCPGRGWGDFDPARYVFRNLDVEETTAHLDAFVRRVRRINPGLKIILTVSPVPLVATMSGEHVVTATTWSKSVLRVAAETIRRRYHDVAYFASYEIITSAATSAGYLESDRREVSQSGIEHVMRSFFSAFADEAASCAVDMASVAVPAIECAGNPCDEELLMRAISDDLRRLQ